MSATWTVYTHVIFLLVVIIAHFVWLAERRGKVTDFRAQYLDGILDGLWWAVVTITTVGYGDKVPQTVPGRIWGVVWMNLGIIIFALVAATSEE